MIVQIRDICSAVYSGGTPNRKHLEYYEGGDIPWLNTSEVVFNRIYKTEKHITQSGLKNSSAKWIPENSVIVAMYGATAGRTAIAKKPLTTNQACCNLIIDPEKADYRYVYYYLYSKYQHLLSMANGGAQQNLNAGQIKEYMINLPDLQTQKKIADILDLLDSKIELNNTINNNLLEQVQTLYHNRFIDTVNNERKICRADEYFDISIGKTPPRKEPQWFSTNPQDFTWVSISDMKSCGLYISSSSEQLTKDAVDRHNVKVVPDNTVLLSFKLTVGRIAITNGEMTTNEAIAHFKTNKKEINEYLYCYLKCFNYQTMGNTSSIATAVNSKIIKGMPFVVPTDKELKEFHDFAAPIFAKIKATQIETDNLATLRDTLLPKLMSGELDVSDIDI